MYCERCKKNQADVHMKQYINGEIKETHLCSQCANEGGYDSFSFNNMFKDLFGFSTDANMFEKNENVQKCPVCSMTYDEFKKGGKLGCSSCYEAFGKGIKNTLRNIHGSDEHKGKIPNKSGGEMLIKREIEGLRKKLAQAVEKEEFEEAARLRDEIKSLTGGGKE